MPRRAVNILWSQLGSLLIYSPIVIWSVAHKNHGQSNSTSFLRPSPSRLCLWFLCLTPLLWYHFSFRFHISITIEGGGDSPTHLDLAHCHSSEISLISQENSLGPLTPNFLGNMVRVRLFFHDVFFYLQLVGDILSFRIFGQVIVILNTTKATKDLLDKRGSIYSDRPTLPIVEMYVTRF